MTDQPSSKTFSGPFSLGADFPTPSLEEWRAIAETSLKGRKLESLTTPVDDGVDAKVLYTTADRGGDPGLPGVFPFTRGGAFPDDNRRSRDTCALVVHPDINIAARQIAEETKRGAHSVWVRFSGGVRCGIDPRSPEASQWNGDGVIVETTDDLERLFDGIDLPATPIHLEAGGNAFGTAAAFIATLRRREINPGSVHGSFNLDPLGALVGDGTLVCGLDRSFALMTPLAAWCLENAPGIRALSVSTLPYHAAGATPVQELALALATGIDLLRTLERGGLEPEAACRQIKFLFATGRDFFTEAAKLRAFRRIWAQAAASCGVDGPEAAAVIHSVSSTRNLTSRDPWVNLLRVTVGAFATTVGGADTVTTLPFDSPVGPSDPLARRIALNTQTICREECRLDQVVDPGGGSWFIEHLTEDLAQAAWTLFQEIENLGGMRRLVADDGLTRLLAPAADRARRQVARRKAPVTGVSTWPNLAEAPVTRDTPDIKALLDHIVSPSPGAETAGLLEQLAKEAAGETASLMETAIEAAGAGATMGQLAEALRHESRPSRTVPLPRISDAAPFERLRDVSDDIFEERGSRPTVFLASLGPIPEHTARATFAKNFFEAGGIAALSDGGFDTTEAAVRSFLSSGAGVACICSSDALYAEGAAPLAAALKQAGASTVCLAGRPGDNETLWREAGIDHFVFIGCDVLEVLEGLMSGAEVAS
ncbi:MAG: methylmalonyl-CoA mutase family protein [Acidobacteriota bacterium]